MDGIIDQISALISDQKLFFDTPLSFVEMTGSRKRLVRQSWTIQGKREGWKKARKEVSAKWTKITI